MKLKNKYNENGDCWCVDCCAYLPVEEFRKIRGTPETRCKYHKNLYLKKKNKEKIQEWDGTIDETELCRCPDCDELIPITEFHIRSNGRPYNYCKRHTSIRNKEAEKQRKEKNKDVVHDENDTKECNVCGETKCISEFHRRNNRGNFTPECKKCSSKIRSLHRKNNREKVNAKQREYRSRIDVNLRESLSHNLRQYFKSAGAIKSKKTFEYVGMTSKEFSKWMEYQLHGGMTIDNYGSLWHIDHMVPASSFDLTKEEDVYECYNWRNLRPMIASENIAKGNKILLDEIEAHKQIVLEYEKIINNSQ